MDDTRLEKLLLKVKPISDLEAQKDKNAKQQALDQFRKDYKKEKDRKVKKAIELVRFPTDLCRSTIFFPLPRKNRKELQSEPIKLEFKTNWSTITYFGMRLSVQDEDLLLICLYLAKKEGKNEFITTYTELQKLLAIIPNQKHNQRLKDAIIRLSIASFCLDFKDKDRQFKAGKGILESEGYKGQLKIIIEENFYKESLHSYTLMSLPFRMQLNGDLSKLLFTFLSSHRTPASYFTDTLAKALNMNRDQDHKYLVKSLKIAFKELQTKGFLIKYSYDKTKDLFTLKPIERKEWKKLK